MTHTDSFDPDPTGLIREAYRIEGIGAAECRSIFLDWAMKLDAAIDPKLAIPVLLQRHGAPDHPMTDVLSQGLATAPTPRRKKRDRC